MYDKEQIIKNIFNNSWLTIEKTHCCNLNMSELSQQSSSTKLNWHTRLLELHSHTTEWKTYLCCHFSIAGWQVCNSWYAYIIRKLHYSGAQTMSYINKLHRSRIKRQLQVRETSGSATNGTTIVLSAANAARLGTSC